MKSNLGSSITADGIARWEIHEGSSNPRVVFRVEISLDKFFGEGPVNEGYVQNKALDLIGFVSRY